MSICSVSEKPSWKVMDIPCENLIQQNIRGASCWLRKRPPPFLLIIILFNERNERDISTRESEGGTRSLYVKTVGRDSLGFAALPRTRAMGPNTIQWIVFLEIQIVYVARAPIGRAQHKQTYNVGRAAADFFAGSHGPEHTPLNNFVFGKFKFG